MPIVHTGLMRMSDAQRTYLATCEWRLYPDDTAITLATVTADLGTEAAWTGYAAQLSTSWGSAYLTGDISNIKNTVLPSFANTSGAPVDFFVVALVDPADDTLIWASNLGIQTIPDGEVYTFAPGVTDQNT